MNLVNYMFERKAGRIIIIQILKRKTLITCLKSSYGFSMRRKRLHSITYVNVYLHTQKTPKYLIIKQLRIQTTMFVLLWLRWFRQRSRQPLFIN